MRQTLLVVVGLGVLAALAFAPPAAAVDDDRVASNATLTSAETYCEGQRAFFGAPNSSANATYRVVKEDVGSVGEATREVQLDANATAVVPTNGLVGLYTLRNESGSAVVIGEDGYQTGTGTAARADWEVLDCDFDARFAESSLTVERDSEATATLEVSASDDDDVLLRSEQLSTAELADRTGGTVTEDGVRVAVGDGQVPFTFPGTYACRAGEYEFTVQGNNTSATTTADLRIEAGSATSPRLGADPVKTRVGGTADIQVETRCNAETSVEIEGNGFLSSATVGAARNESNVVLRFDTSRAGSAPAAELFSGAGGGTLLDASVSSRPESEELPPGSYELRVLAPDGGLTDRGTLRVRSTATPSPTPTATATPSPTPTAVRTTVGADRTDSPVATPTPTSTPAATASPSPTPPPTATPTAGSPATASPTPAPVTGTGGQPGFGAVVAMLALALVSLLARCRA